MSRKKKWLIGIAAAALLGFAALVVAGSILAQRFEPYVREQAIEYLHKRFDSDVELATLRVHFSKTSPLRLLLTKGRGALVRVEGEGISLRHKGRRDVPPMFAMKKFRSASPRRANGRISVTTRHRRSTVCLRLGCSSTR